MKFYDSLRWLALAVLSALFLLSFAASAAEAKKDAQSVMNEMRLKKWTKDLTLTPEQQKKVQVILDEEGQQIAKLDENTAGDLNKRKTKVNELRLETYAKIKPILSAVQLENFEKALAKMQPKKK
jgi:hypothetical protein